MPGAGGSPALPVLDVDGPLIPFGAPLPGLGSVHSARSGRERSDLPPQVRLALDSNPLLGLLDPRVEPWLADLPCDLVWATTWMDDANTTIGLLLGLPELPVP